MPSDEWRWDLPCGKAKNFDHTKRIPHQNHCQHCGLANPDPPIPLDMTDEEDPTPSTSAISRSRHSTPPQGRSSSLNIDAAQQFRNASIANQQATKTKYQRPHIGSTQHSQRLKEPVKSKKEIKDEPDVIKGTEDYKFTVTFLTQDEKGKWSVPLGVPGIEPDIPRHAVITSFSDIVNLWRVQYQDLDGLCERFKRQPRFSRRRLNSKAGPLALSDRAFQKGDMTDFLKSLLVDKDVKNSKMPQYNLILFWEYSAEDDTHTQDDEEDKAEAEEEEDFIFSALSRKRPRATSNAEDTPRIKAEPISPARSTPRPRGPRNPNLRPFWESASASIDTLIEETDAIIQEGREDAELFEEEDRAFTESIGGSIRDRADATESTAGEDKGESVIDTENLVRANAANEDLPDVPAANTRGKHGIMVPKKQF